MKTRRTTKQKELRSYLAHELQWLRTHKAEAWTAYLALPVRIGTEEGNRKYDNWVRYHHKLCQALSMVRMFHDMGVI